jgi:hypothetical protein
MCCISSVRRHCNLHLRFGLVLCGDSLDVFPAYFYVSVQNSSRIKCLEIISDFALRGFPLVWLWRGQETVIISVTHFRMKGLKLYTKYPTDKFVVQSSSWKANSSHLVKKFPVSYGTQVSLSCLQERTTGFCPEPDESNPRPKPCFPKISFNIIFASLARFLEWCLLIIHF